MEERRTIQMQRAAVAQLWQAIIWIVAKTRVPTAEVPAGHAAFPDAIARQTADPSMASPNTTAPIMGSSAAIGNAAVRSSESAVNPNAVKYAATMPRSGQCRRHARSREGCCGSAKYDVGFQSWAHR